MNPKSSGIVRSTFLRSSRMFLIRGYSETKLQFSSVRNGTFSALWPDFQSLLFELENLLLLITNLTHFFVYLFISSLYMFRASQCPSSGDRIVLIHRLAWLVCVSDCLVCRSWPAYQALFIYFISLHVSSITVLIIRRSNCINTSSGMISLWGPAYQAVTYTD